MKKLLILTILATLDAYAIDYIPIIREDRVWEYVYSEGINLPTFDVKGEVGRQIFRMRFDGTEEHNGHVYHRLKYTGDLTRVVF